MLDKTHAISKSSWVKSANQHENFPIQNLPHCVFSLKGEARKRGGIAIGDSLLDLSMLPNALALDDLSRQGVHLAGQDHLNDFIALPPSVRRAVRTAISEGLDSKAPDSVIERLRPHLYDAAQCELHLPARVGDFTDFFAGIHHAINAGRSFRPDSPLLPNYKYVPVAYHGRSSSVAVSGTPVHRPRGQIAQQPDSPELRPSGRLDFEVELGLWPSGGNRLGMPIPIEEAGDNLFGMSLLNDWSARDIQMWESQPLGPFLGKNFITSISPFIVTVDALEPFRSAQSPRSADDPQPLPYLMHDSDQQSGAFDIHIQTSIITPQMRSAGMPAQLLSTSNALDLYWTPAQLITHHAVNGCNLRAGDLLGTGTISSPNNDGHGSLLEMSQGGKKPIVLANGEIRSFLLDGDEVVISARCVREGARSIGFGSVIGRVVER